jgi:serine protease Do
MIQPVTPDLAKAFKLEKSEGALISELTSGSPAERAGLKPGDVVTKVNDRVITDSRSLQLMIGEMTPGSTVRLTAVRDGVAQQHSVILGEQPADGIETPGTYRSTNSERVLEGLDLESLTPEVAREFGINRTVRGVAVSRVDPNSAAAKTGLAQGDVIVEVNRQPVSSVEQVHRLVRSGTTDTTLLLVHREGRTRYVVVP